MTQIQLSQMVDNVSIYSMKVYNVLSTYIVGMMLHLLDIISNLFLNFVRNGKKQKRLQFSEDAVVPCDTTVRFEYGESMVFSRSISEISVHTTESEIPSGEVITDINTNQSHNCYTLREDGTSCYEIIQADEENALVIQPSISYGADELKSIRDIVQTSNYKPAFLFNNPVLDSIIKTSSHVEKSRIGTSKKRKMENTKLNENLDMIIDVESSNSDVEFATVHQTAFKPKSYANDSDDSEKKIDSEDNLTTVKKDKANGKMILEKKNSYPKKKQNPNASTKENIINASTDHDWRRKSDSKSEEDTNDHKFKWYNRRDKKSNYQPAKRYTRENP